VDFIALKTITSIDPTNARNSSVTPKQPSGTNHFQFRFHQFGFGVGESAGLGSTQFFYSEANGFCNAVLKRPIR